MKTVLLTMAVWVLTMAASYGQIRGTRMGSAEAERRLEEWRQHLAEQKAHREKRKADFERGRSLFGADERWPMQIGTLDYPGDFKVGDWGCTEASFQAISKVSNTECLVRPMCKGSKVMLLRGLDMSKVTDGVEFILQHPIVIQGTYSYTVVSGAEKTVLVLERNDSKLDKLIAKAHEQAEAERTAAEANRKAAEAQAWLERWNKDKHTWTDKSGKYSVEAVYDDYLGDGRIRLLRKDKSEIVIHLSKLSEPDRRNAVDLRRARKNSPQGAE